MNLFSESSESYIENTREEAEYLKKALEHLGKSQNFSLTNLVRHGAVCADVEYGREAYALLPYHPPVLILGEKPADTIKRIEAIDKALGLFTKPVIVKRLDAISLVQELSNDSRVPKVGLVTWLRIFPRDISSHEINTFASVSQKLLVPGGRMILSFNETDNLEVDMFSEMMGYGVDGLKLSVVEPKFGAAGRLILLGEKS